MPAPTEDFAAATQWFVGLFIASISMTVGNKYVAVNYPYSNCMIFFQNSVAIINLLVGEKFGFFKFKPFTLMQLLQITVPAIFLSLQIMASLKALPYVAVATTVVFRNLATFSVAMAEKIFLGKSLVTKQIYGLCIIVVGGLIYAWQDINFNATGYFWLTFNCLIYTTSSIYTKKIVADIDQTSDGTALLQQIGSLPFIFLYALFFDELPQGISKVFTLNMLPMVVFIFLGFMGTLIALSYMNLYKRVSATTVTVASNVNKVISIFVAWLVFRKILSVLQIVGLTISISGGLYYAIETGKAKQLTKKKKSIEMDQAPTSEQHTQYSGASRHVSMFPFFFRHTYCAIVVAAIMSVGNAIRIILSKNKKYCVQEIKLLLRHIHEENEQNEQNAINKDKSDDGIIKNQTLNMVLQAAIEQWSCQFLKTLNIESTSSSNAYNSVNDSKSMKYIKYAKGLVYILVKQYRKQCKQYLISKILCKEILSSQSQPRKDDNATDVSNTSEVSALLSYKIIVFYILKQQQKIILGDGENIDNKNSSHNYMENRKIIVELKNISETLFRKKHYIIAIDILTFIISKLVSTQDAGQCALLLSNRAACLLQVKQLKNCIDDCTNGLLKLDISLTQNEQQLEEVNRTDEKKNDLSLFYKVNKTKLHVRRASAIVDFVLNVPNSKSKNHNSTQNSNTGSKFSNYKIDDAIDDHDIALKLLNTLNDATLKTLLPLLLDLNKINTICNTVKLKIQADDLFRNANNNNNNSTTSYETNHNVKNAYSIYSTILKDVPTYISVLNNRASTSLALGKFDEAIKDTTFALELLDFEQKEASNSKKYVIIGYHPSKVNDPKLYNSWIVKILAKRGAAYVQLNEYPKAFQDFKRCVALDETNDVRLKDDLKKVELKL